MKAQNPTVRVYFSTDERRSNRNVSRHRKLNNTSREINLISANLVDERYLYFSTRRGELWRKCVVISVLHSITWTVRPFFFVGWEFVQACRNFADERLSSFFLGATGGALFPFSRSTVRNCPRKFGQQSERDGCKSTDFFLSRSNERTFVYTRLHVSKYQLNHSPEITARI